LRHLQNNPLRIGLDTSALNPNFKAHATRGIGRYVRELNNYFQGIDHQDISVGQFEHDQVIGNGPVKTLIDLAPFGRTTLRQQIMYPMKLSDKKQCNFDILHFPAHMDPPAWGLKNYIVTVLDLVPLVLSDLYKAINPNWRFRLARYLELKAITNASLIIAISENTADDVNRILNIPREKIVVTPLGVDKKFFIDGFLKEDIEGTLRKYKIPTTKDLILYVGGIDPRKNMVGLLKSFKILKEGNANGCSTKNVVLVIAGKIEEDKQYPELLRLIKENDLTNDVVLTGFIPDADLFKVFSATKVFFFPSLYEGFGFTPLEAMAAGVAVVSSDRSSMPEVLGDAGILVDPEDYKACADALGSVLSDDNLRVKLAHSGRERASKFTWAKTGEETLKAYQRFLNR